MQRAERTKLLIEVGRQEAMDMAKMICEQYEVIDIQEPRAGLVMVKMRESAKQSLFYIGEVLVTEAKVKVGDAFGLGIVREEEPVFARALAVIDAAYNGNFAPQEWATIFTNLSQRLETEQQQTKRSIERTKVQFDTMQV